jgi:sugar (pentulose or hexulose) kinase
MTIRRPEILAPAGDHDALAAALAAGALGKAQRLACTAIDGTAFHLRIGSEAEIPFDDAAATTTAPFLVPGAFATMVRDADAGLHREWLPGLMEQLIADVGLIGIARGDLASVLEVLAAEARPGALLFHASGRNGRNPAQLARLSWHARPGDLMRSIHEGIAFSARDGHAALGPTPDEIRVAGRPALDPLLRRILAACFDRPLRSCMRRDPAGSGAAIVAAVALGQYGDARDAMADWVEPYLTEPEAPEPDLAAAYESIFQTWRRARDADDERPG